MEGLEAVALGLFEGVKTGLKDDWDFAMTVKHGLVLAGNWGWTRAESELIQWRDNPAKRASQLKQGLDRFVAEAVFVPLQNLGSDFSTWEGFKKRAWATWDKVKGGAAKLWTINSSLSVQIAGGLVSWVDDFHGRMLQGGERVAFQNTPWNQNALINDLTGYGRECAYTFGYVYGYLIEQVAVGVATGGTLKVAQVMVKGGVVLAGNLSSKALLQIAARSHLLKKQLASVALSIELRLAIERGLVQATKMPISETIRDSAGVVVENHLSKVIVDRNLFNLKVLVEAAVEKPNIRKLFEQTGTDWLVLHRFALFMALVGDAADHSMLNNFVSVFEKRLIVPEASGLYVDWTEDFLRSADGVITKFSNRPPLQPLNADAIARINELTRPGGSIFNAPPIGDTARGCIGEVHLANTEYREWLWSPAQSALDFFSFSKGNIAAQLKISRNPSYSSLTIAIDKLIQKGTEQHATSFVLDVRKISGLDTTGLEALLRQYVRDSFPQNIIDNLTIIFREYEFVP